MPKFITYFAVMLLAGCASQTKVHIFSAGIEDSEIENLSSLLSRQGFDAQPNSLPVPKGFVSHTVIFPAIVQNFALVEQIKSAMGRAGYSTTQLILETEANHYYSSNNIGIYLVNPDFEDPLTNQIADAYALGGSEATPLTYNYFSECPEGSEAQSELNLYPSGMAILEEFVWDEEDNREFSVLHDGEWKSDATAVEVKLFDGGILQFSIEEHSGSNWFGPYDGLTLKNQLTSIDIESCNYTYLKYKESNF